MIFVSWWKGRNVSSRESCVFGYILRVPLGIVYFSFDLVVVFFIMFHSFFLGNGGVFFSTWSMNISKYDWYIFIKSIFSSAEHPFFVKRNGFRYEIIVVEEKYNFSKSIIIDVKRGKRAVRDYL